MNVEIYAVKIDWFTVNTTINIIRFILRFQEHFPFVHVNAISSIYLF